MYLSCKGKKKNNWDYIKLKSTRAVKEIINKRKRQPTKGENIFTNDIANKGLIFWIYKNSYNLTPKNHKLNKNKQRT